MIGQKEAGSARRRNRHGLSWRVVAVASLLACAMVCACEPGPGGCDEDLDCALIGHSGPACTDDDDCEDGCLALGEAGCDVPYSGRCLIHDGARLCGFATEAGACTGQFEDTVLGTATLEAAGGGTVEVCVNVASVCSEGTCVN